MAITAEQLEEIQRAAAANYARQIAMTNEMRLNAGKFTIDLVKAPDDPGEGEQSFQDELSHFGAGLRTAGIAYSQSKIFMDAVDAQSFPLPEYVVALKTLGTTAIPALAALGGAWLQARYGRKVRVRIGDVEAEARTIAEIETILEMAAKFQDRATDESKEP